jgi:hypothetical protein
MSPAKQWLRNAPEGSPLHPMEVASCTYCMPSLAQGLLMFTLRPSLDMRASSSPMMGKGHDPIEEGSWRQQRAAIPPRCTPSANFGVENNANNGHDQTLGTPLADSFRHWPP